MSQTTLDSELSNNIKAITLQCDMPRAYQQEAIDQVLNIFKQHARTHIVMACGTGKTRVALWVGEQLEAKNIVVFVPSLALVRQLMEEWIKTTIWPSVSCLAVCSDETVTYGVDSITVDPRECGFPVTTDSVEIHRFLKNATNSVRVVFCTYQSSVALSEGMQGCQPFDYGVFDEAHKTTGNNYFGLAVDNEAVPIQKRLFMTATPKHYNISKKNQAGEAKLAYSMDSETLYGPRAYTLSFRKAINLGIITDYKIMISVVSTQQAVTLESELDGKIVALRKAVLKDPNIAKVITFHKTIKEARAFSLHIQSKHDTLPDFTTLHVNSLMSSYSRHGIMHTFQKSAKSIISNARCLTEGIDVPAIDMVAFLNAKKSKVDIVQAIGRAMRKVPGKMYGYVFLPLFVDQNAGESIEEAILRADYEDVWEVVQAFSEQDENLHATIKWLKQEKGKTGTLAPGLERYLEISHYNDTNILLQEQLKKIISIAIVDKVASNWHEMYGKLTLFKELHHHSNVPNSYKDTSLLFWVHAQRQFYKNGVLSQDKINLLEAIEFAWDANEASWNRYYQELKVFKESNSHCNVPVEYQQNKCLGHWVSNQRNRYKKGVLSENRIKLLNDIGFAWNPSGTYWNFHYESLKEFKAKNDHFNVPVEYQQNKCLAYWMSGQRNSYKNGKLSANKIKLLKAIGFEWNPLDTNWNLRYEELKAFKAINNHCNVPGVYQQNKCLGQWVHKHRRCYKNGKLSANKIKLLEAIGFKWNPLDTNWNLRYEELKVFKSINNHCNVPNAYQRNKCLAKWVACQRSYYKNKKLLANKIKLLEDIGFEWNPLDATWHLQYEKLKAFKAINNHCNVPRKYPQDTCFGMWVQTQRQFYKNESLSENKIKLLEVLGFEWNPLDANWNLCYEELKVFKAINNHCNVPKIYQQNKCLGQWVGGQRNCYKNRKLSANKIKLLEVIGFVWKPLDTNWDFHYEALKVFKEKNKHFNVPKVYQQNKHLGRWVNRQRQLYKNEELSANRIKLLEAIGFEWKRMLQFRSL